MTRPSAIRAATVRVAASDAPRQHLRRFLVRTIRRVLSLAMLGLAACDSPTATLAPPRNVARVSPRQVTMQDRLQDSTPPIANGSWSTVVRRSTGAPRAATFSVPRIPGSYRLELFAWEGSAPTGTVAINGVPVVQSSDFAKLRDIPITRVITLNATNDVEVRLTGAPGSAVLVRLIGVHVEFTDTVRWRGLCAMESATQNTPLACFDATLAATWLADQRTMLTVQLRNLQGGIPAALPPSAMTSVAILAREGSGPVPVGPLTVNTSGATAVTGTAMPTVGTGTVRYPPYPGGPSFNGVNMQGFALTGCAVPPTLIGQAVWQTCGSMSGSIVLSTVVAGWWRTTDLFAHFTFIARPVGLPQPSCATGPVPTDICRPLLP